MLSPWSSSHGNDNSMHPFAHENLPVHLLARLVALLQNVFKIFNYQNPHSNLLSKKSLSPYYKFLPTTPFLFPELVPYSYFYIGMYTVLAFMKTFQSNQKVLQHINHTYVPISLPNYWFSSISQKITFFIFMLHIYVCAHTHIPQY